MLWLFPYFLFLLSVLGNTQSTLQKDDQMKQSLPRQGIHEMVLKLKDGYFLSYTVSVPLLKQGQLVPLVLALHYGGDVTPYYGRGYLEVLVDPAFKNLDAIIIAPDCPGKNWTDPKSEAAILELLDFVKHSWPVDSSRFVVTGFSMGGIGSWFLAERHSELFSAVIPMAARPSREFNANIPVYVIHGRNDEIFDIKQTKETIKELVVNGRDIELVIVENLSHYETSGYVKHLKGAVKWLKKIWNNGTIL